MKVRNGFVSNSSSSSFVIYGIEADRSKIEQVMKDNLGEYRKIWENPELTEEELIYDYWEACEVLSDILSVDVYNTEYGTYLGREWQYIGDNETGAEFKTGIKEGLIKSGFNQTPYTIDEVMPC